MDKYLNWSLPPGFFRASGNIHEKNTMQIKIMW